MIGELCHCGRPLHYTDPNLRRMVEEIVAECGTHVVVTVPELGAFKVPRHYIALHGMRAQDVTDLGFERVVA